MILETDLILLCIIAVFTSCFAAVFGMGGGVILISVMPGFVPLQALIPIHGVVQLASNSSRVAFGFRHIRFDLIRKYLIGAVIGVALGAPCVLYFPFDILPLVLGVFVLFIAWVPLPKVHDSKYLIPILGFIQVFLSLFVGVAGLVASAFLFHQKLKKDDLVITLASFATLTHLLKIVVYGFLGLFTISHFYFAITVAIAAILGSWAGTHLRGKVPERFFRPVFKSLVIILGLRLIIKHFL
ncbi:MAG: sulfite exporter TauE/SafE family protein [Bdellovibrionota bacterium]